MNMNLNKNLNAILSTIFIEKEYILLVVQGKFMVLMNKYR